MTESGKINNIKDHKIDLLQNYYQKYSVYFINYQAHLEKLFADNIINISERNNLLKIIMDLIRQLNLVYNNNMIEICESDNNSEKPPENYENFHELTEINRIIGLSKLIQINQKIKKQTNFKPKFKLLVDPFAEIKNLILNNIAAKIGFKSIIMAMELLIGSNWQFLYNSDTLNKINLFDKIFLPLKYSIDKIEKNPSELILKKIDLNRDIIIQNSLNFSLKKNLCSEYYICLHGYINTDPLNITVRTSQISNPFIYHKKKDLENYLINRITRINITEKFIKDYIRNSPLSDILLLSKDEYLKLIQSDHEFYNKITKLPFLNLMKEFIKDESNNNNTCIKNMFLIIKLLLLGSDENINMAGLLFGISKEKKTDTNCTIADIIYRNLNYISQVKLKRSAINIKNELERIKTMSVEDIDLKKQIAICKNMPLMVKNAALEKIEEMKASNNEYYKQLLYVRTLLNYPWPSGDEDLFFSNIGASNQKSKEFLDTVIKKLNNKVYGHIECKESIKELIGKWICNPSSSGNAIGLAGPPGVGKTLLAKAMGESLGIPFVQITLGGQNDGELLHGHGYTYSGAQPGMIIKKMVEAGSARCIMYFDELDKACKRYDSNEIYNILIHITDSNTNSEFQDRFFQEIKFPLNKVLFIFSYNDSALIDNILMDRIKEIEIKPFKLQDKKNIITNFLVKEMCELVNFDLKSISLREDDIEFIINQYTNEPGVRELKRKFEKIFLKLNIDRIYNMGSTNKLINLTKELIEKYLGKHNIQIQYIHTEDQVGVINGLYATESGNGGILPIQIYDNYTNGDDKFTLKLTGSQRRIMRESVISAFTSAIHCVKESIRIDYIKNHAYGFHIHTPSGAVPKDGPSAGCAFATAFVSRILNKKIKHDIAITGEIELTGKVTKIGGLQYKLPGAKRAGVKLVLISSENKDDVDQLRKEYTDLIDSNFNIKFVENLRDVLEYAFVDFDKHDINN